MTAIIFPVGEFIKDELAERGMTVRDLAEKMGGDVPINVLALDLLISAPQKGVTLGVEMANRIASVFGTSPDIWINLDTSWQNS